MYYHGTNIDKEFKTLVPNELGLVWITDDKNAAKRYASKYYNEGDSRIFYIKITGQILDFTNKEDEIVKEIIDKVKSDYLFDIEKHWDTSAGFGIIEKNIWIIDYLKSKGYSGIKVLDMSGAYDHDSIALFNENFEIENIEEIENE